MADFTGSDGVSDYYENLINPDEDDYIDGLGGNDTVFGRGGDDILVGNLGSNDILSGGVGTDTFKLYTSNEIKIFLEGYEPFNISQPFVLDVVNKTIHLLPGYVGVEDSLNSGDSTGNGDNISLLNASSSNPTNAIIFDANGNPLAVEEITSSVPFFFGIDNDLVYNPALTLLNQGYFDNSPYLDVINAGDFNTNPLVEIINANIIANNPLFLGFDL